ncbi:sensor histidine kinase [Planctomicrobium piriforme]|uniref:histidine kinase n=1 Tax=Planctomicrobium piriforme TaxID=1576369 RepID=A0A1I3MRC2_9PLAN|nr:HAMP domain-containing sensor histidine kinase [Planctomicrobium piriforme]SFI99543.1 His Kinase A (phospho-acceptor) domain-containing protein [Planctomicrobium piriforme]
MAIYFRRRSKIHLPITLSVSLMALNVTLMVCWIIILAKGSWWTTLAIGVVAFTMILAGLSVWLVLTLKEINLNNRQANFVDSVTHELKSPIAALQLYLETLSLRHLSDEKRNEFHGIMAGELQRLDKLINQLLEVGRLDAIGESEEPQDILLQPLIEQFVDNACMQWNVTREDAFRLDLQPVVIRAGKIVMDLILTNLIENAVKYAGDPPEVQIQLKRVGKNRVQLRITNNGLGVPHEDRKKIFQIFYRGGSELERRRKGTGLGLYIVHTLVKKMRGRVTVHDRHDGLPGCTFELELPGRVDPPQALPLQKQPAAAPSL